MFVSKKVSSQVKSKLIVQRFPSVAFYAPCDSDDTALLFVNLALYHGGSLKGPACTVQYPVFVL